MRKEKHIQKVTKKDNYEFLKRLVAEAQIDNRDDLTFFIDKQIAAIDYKAEKAKERAEERKAEGDELRSVVEAVLTEEYQTVDEIMEQIDGEDLTKAKVVARLAQLVKNGDAVKTVEKMNGKRVMTYKLSN